MRPPCLFGMITTRASAEYTGPALNSFFSNTELVNGDEFVLIDNDASYLAPLPPNVSLKPRSQPQSFAENANYLLKRSGQRFTVILNNDLIFTKNWLPSLISEDAISSPMSNGQVTYTTPRLKLPAAMSLSDFQNGFEDLELIGNEHAHRMIKPLNVMILPFFCAVIPPRVRDGIGLFDQAFRPAGGEDFDYCLRAILAGYRVQYAPRSFILHFGGASTWAGPEGLDGYRSRAPDFIRLFEKKWGSELTTLVFQPPAQPFAEAPELLSLMQKQDFREIIRRLMPQ